MTTLELERIAPVAAKTETMLAAVFRGPNDVRLEQVRRPVADASEALIRVTLTTICGTDVHILKGEYPVREGLVVGHEAVGVIEELGAAVTGYRIGQRVLVGAITPCGQCRACLTGHQSQCGEDAGYRALGGWRFGNTINGAQAQYLIVPNAQANLAPIPDELEDEDVILLADVASTGIGGAEAGGVRLGDTVAVFALGPIGICAAIGARLLGASRVIGVDGDEDRRAMARRMGVDVVLDYHNHNVIAEINALTGGVDVAIEALGSQETFENCLRVLRPGGTLSSLGVYAGKLQIPYEAFGAGLADYRIVTSLCPGGKDRMMRLMSLVRSWRLNLRPLLTHRFPLRDIQEAYRIFAERQDAVMKVAVRP